MHKHLKTKYIKSTGKGTAMSGRISVKQQAMGQAIYKQSTQGQEKLQGQQNKVQNQKYQPGKQEGLTTAHIKANIMLCDVH